MNVLITSPPMHGMINELRHHFDDKGIGIHCPEVVQAMKEEDLLELVPKFEGWIIGDDPANRRVFKAGKAGLLKAAVKWGVGVDNVDFDAASDLSIPVTNTPHMFGQEVGDIVMSYVTALARKTFLVDREVKAGMWPKPRGISLAGKTMGIVGLGDTGKAIAKRAIAADMSIIAYTPSGQPCAVPGVSSSEFAAWPDRIEECDFIVLACPLNASNWHMLDSGLFDKVKRGVRIVNTARGALISERALIDALADGRVHSAAFDVFEAEPLPMTSPLRNFEKCIFGSHNASNTTEAVMRTSLRAIDLLLDILGYK